ncbi:hypothetical protein ACQP2T_24915 [Nonomuraea sp. CA-143628]|uniref:hypothetical protein n=1 Tax=Nonomuraea sp. CA-143628 TaxID=3239997 RepID=UPI003D8C4109
MGSRTAISAGALALALAAIPVVSSPALAEAADCKRGDGLLSGVTNGLCDVVEAVTGTVDTLTGDTLKPVTKKVGGTADDLLGTVGDAVPTTIPTRAGQPQPTPSDQELLPNTLSEVCLPVVACEHQDAQQRNKDPEHVLETPSPDDSAKPTPTAKPNKREKKDSTTTLPTDGPTPPETDSHEPDTTADPIKIQTADTDEPRIDLLWPNPFVQDLTAPLRDQPIIRPSKPASDVLGTSLTIALLTSAILATRIVQQRRQRTEQPDSIPFEPARANNGRRHRLA